MEGGGACGGGSEAAQGQVLCGERGRGRGRGDGGKGKRRVELSFTLLKFLGLFDEEQ